MFENILKAPAIKQVLVSINHLDVFTFFNIEERSNSSHTDK